jgi:hypothetical protein
MNSNCAVMPPRTIDNYVPVTRPRVYSPQESACCRAAFVLIKMVSYSSK